LVNVTKLKTYKYGDQTLKEIQSSKSQMSLESIDSYHKEEKFDDDLEDQRTKKIIGTN
jgi:hypothetical protein